MSTSYPLWLLFFVIYVSVELCSATPLGRDALEAIDDDNLREKYLESVGTQNKYAASEGNLRNVEKSYSNMGDGVSQPHTQESVLEQKKTENEGPNFKTSHLPMAQMKELRGTDTSRFSNPDIWRHLDDQHSKASQENGVERPQFSNLPAGDIQPTRSPDHLQDLFNNQAEQGDISRSTKNPQMSNMESSHVNPLVPQEGTVLTHGNEQSEGAVLPNSNVNTGQQTANSEDGIPKSYKQSSSNTGLEFGQERQDTPQELLNSYNKQGTNLGMSNLPGVHPTGTGINSQSELNPIEEAASHQSAVNPNVPQDLSKPDTAGQLPGSDQLNTNITENEKSDDDDANYNSQNIGNGQKEILGNFEKSQKSFANLNNEIQDNFAELLSLKKQDSEPGGGDGQAGVLSNGEDQDVGNITGNDDGQDGQHDGDQQGDEKLEVVKTYGNIVDNNALPKQHYPEDSLLDVPANNLDSDKTDDLNHSQDKAYDEMNRNPNMYDDDSDMNTNLNNKNIIDDNNESAAYNSKDFSLDNQGDLLDQSLDNKDEKDDDYNDIDGNNDVYSYDENDKVDEKKVEEIPSKQLPNDWYNTDTDDQDQNQDKEFIWPRDDDDGYDDDDYDYDDDNAVEDKDLVKTADDEDEDMAFDQLSIKQPSIPVDEFGNDLYRNNARPSLKEGVVEYRLETNRKPMNMPSSMVLFYTWIILFVLVTIVSVSAFRYRCKGLIPGVSRNFRNGNHGNHRHVEENKRLLDNVYT